LGHENISRPSSPRLRSRLHGCVWAPILRSTACSACTHYLQFLPSSYLSCNAEAATFPNFSYSSLAVKMMFGLQCSLNRKPPGIMDVTQLNVSDWPGKYAIVTFPRWPFAIFCGFNCCDAYSSQQW